MHGKISKDSVVGGAASRVWEIYRGFALGRFVNQHLSDVIGTVNFIEGDGGVGSVIRLTFAPPPPPGNPGVGYMAERFTITDDEKRIKEAEQIEGGYLALGFSSFRVRLEIIENASHESSIVKTTIDYDIDDKLSENASLVTFNTLDMVAEAVHKHLSANKASA